MAQDKDENPYSYLDPTKPLLMYPGVGKSTKLEGQGFVSNMTGGSTFGESKYDDKTLDSEFIESGDYEFARGEEQNGFAQLGLGILRTASKALIETIKTPAYLYSLGEWAGSNMFGKGMSIDKALDNVILNTLEDVEDEYKEVMPVYQSYKAGKGGILDVMGTTSFWASEGADGLGYMLGMMGPGFAIKSLNMSAKISKLGLGSTNKVAKFVGQNADNIELGTQTLANTFVESLAEAKGAIDHAKAEGVTDPEKLAELGRETFFGNMALLIGPNLIMNKALLGRGNVHLDEYRDATGKLTANRTKKAALGDYLKSAGVGVVSEGFVEEGGQTSIENYEVNKALGNTKDGFIEGVAKEYLNNTLSSLEGQKSILLGAVLGGLGNSFGKYRERQFNNKNQSRITKMINSNYEGYSVDNDIWERDDNGNIVFEENSRTGKSEPKVNAYQMQQALKNEIGELRDSQLRDLATLDNNEVLADYIGNLQFNRWAIPFLEQGEIGIDILNEKLDDIKENKELLDKRHIVEAKGLKLDNNQYIAGLKTKAKQLEDIYNQTRGIIEDLPFINKMMESEDPKVSAYASMYMNRLLNATFQETAKQVFIKEKLRDLDLEVSKLNSVIFNDLPQNKVLADRILKDQRSLNNILQESIENYNAILDENEHKKAFEDFIEVTEQEEQDVEEQVKKNEPPPVTQDDVDIAEKSNIVNEKLIKALDAKTFEEFEPLYKELKKSALLDPKDKVALDTRYDSLVNSQFPEVGEVQQNPAPEREPTNKPIETDPNQDIISQALTTFTIANDETKQGELVTDDVAEQAMAGKHMAAFSNVGMMHLFNHDFYYDNEGHYYFKFKRNNEGLPAEDNNSGLDIDALNAIQEGDIITLEFEELTPEQAANFEAPPDFDGRHIVAKFNGKKVFYIQQPHPINPLAVSPESIEARKAAREELIAYRKAIIEKLTTTNEPVTERIISKGNGNLYTKLTEKGKIDPVNKVIRDARDKDKLAGIVVFAFQGQKYLELPEGTEIDEADLEEINEALVRYPENFAKPGRMFQVIRDVTNSWSVIPVYANKINKVTTDLIMSTLDRFDKLSDPQDVAQALNRYIYTSTTKENVALFINNKNGELTFFTNQTSFSLDNIKNNPVVRQKFIESLQTNRQNISAYDLNTVEGQKELNKRDTIVTNVLPYQNKEYYVQPFLQYSHDNLPKVEPKEMTTIDELSVEVNQTNTDINNSEDIDKIIEEGNKIFGDDESLNDDPYAESKTKFKGSPVDLKAFNKWLSDKLPQLSVAEGEILGRLKANYVDSYGLYKDLVIFLFEGSTNQTAYHEAFHGVFRNILSLDQKQAILEEAAKKYPKPTMQELTDLQSPLSKQYSIKQLTYLYYEEKLADEFAQYTVRYNDRTFLEKLGDAIKEFFNMILESLGLFSRPNQTEIEKVFRGINKGVYKKDSVRNRNLSDITIFNRPFEVFNNEYAHSREVRSVFTPIERETVINTIANKYVALYQEKANLKQSTKGVVIYSEIAKVYADFIKRAVANPTGFKAKDYKLAVKIHKNFPLLITEVDKNLSVRGISTNTTNIELTSELSEDELSESEIATEGGSRVTKGFGEQTSISGLSSASRRIKMFLHSIPVINKETGEIKKDVFGIEQYYPFEEIYYHLERNLTGVYTLEDQLVHMDRIARTRPEIRTVINKLGYEVKNRKPVDLKPTNINAEELEILRNDFKTNFSKQQLIYTLVKFDTDSKTGKVTYKIMESNRKGISYEVEDSWMYNLINPHRDTIAEHDSDGKYTIFGTKDGIQLLDIWRNHLRTISRGAKPDSDITNKILMRVGIEMSPETLEVVLSKETYIRDITNVISWYADPNGESNSSIGRESLDNLVHAETDTILTTYTQSFNDVENKNVYSIQLPSLASKKMAWIKSEPSKFQAGLQDLYKDPYFRHSNLLAEMKGDFRTNDFKLTFLDGLKDDRGESSGKKFTAMGPKDFMSMQIALFQNEFINKARIQKPKVAKYIYVTPSDKTMSMIFDSKVYDVVLELNSRDKRYHIDPNSEICEKFYNVVLMEVSRIKHNMDIKNDIISNRGKGKYKLKNLKEHYHMSKSNFSKLSKMLPNEANFTEKDWLLIEELFDGQAYKFNNDLNFLNKDIGISGDKESRTFNILNNVKELVKNGTVEQVEDLISLERSRIISLVAKELTNEFHDTLDEMEAKELITRDRKTNIRTSKSLDVKIVENKSEDLIINELAASFTVNTWLANIELSSLLNGDPAMYKPNDLQKRTYQSQSMITNNRFATRSIKTLVVKDYETATDKDTYDAIVKTLQEQGYTKKQIEDIAGSYEGGINVTDAQVYITPAFFKEIHMSRGTWTPELAKAFNIMQGLEKGPVLPEHRMQLAAIKPFYYGNRFDSNLGIHVYEQVKCAMLPLFKGYVEINPLLKEKLEQMEANGIDMLAHESSFKASIGYRESIENELKKEFILELEPDNFGIQVDNPIHSTDEENDSMRQLKMLILGSIDKNKTYKGIKGSDIIKNIMKHESTNIAEGSDETFNKLDVKTNEKFADFVKEMVTKRGATISIEEILKVVNGEFEYALDNGNLSTQVENLISSIITNNVIKQSFAGDARVQASSIGVQWKSKENLTKVEKFKGFWTREQVKNQPDKVFLFGDNTDDRINTKHIPSSTQAVIRGLDNAIGIDTKKNRGTSTNSYFTDFDFDTFKKQVDEAIEKALATGKTIVIPEDGIGTGKAMLEQKAPKLFKYLQHRLEALEKTNASINKLTQNLKWIKPVEGSDDVEYAECIMPAWSKQFFNKDGTLIDVENIPANLREMICYRIPTEGLHSILPIRVVAFLPETMGNFILLPYEVTKQMGADFDFDKLFFINKEFHSSFSENGRQVIEEYKYIDGETDEDVKARWNQYRRYTRYLIDELKENVKHFTFDEFKKLSVERQNIKPARNNSIIDSYLTILTSKQSLNLLIKPSGFEKLEKIKDFYHGTRQVGPFFSSKTQREYKSRNHTGIALKGQSALHVSGHSYATLMNISSVNTSINFNGKYADNFSGLYTEDKSLIADELSSIMAAILDDIKKPILESLGINKNTIDTLCTIIRAGHNMNTALMFISQPAIKELSTELDKNTSVIKEPGQGWFSVKSVIEDYKLRLDEQLEAIGENKDTNYLLNDPEFMRDIRISEEDYADTNISDKMMNDYLQMKINKNTTPVELAKYYAFQLRVLRNFDSINNIAKQLTEINKFFGINKQVGPNVEDIIGKKELLDQIEASELITGFDIKDIPTLEETWEAHQRSLDYFNQYFPYATPYYMEIKRKMFMQQFGKPLNEINIKDRQFVNGFIRYITDNTFEYFRNLDEEYDDLFLSLPNLINDIQNNNKSDQVYQEKGKRPVPYSYLKDNLFIKNIKDSLDEKNGIYYLALKANRLDLATKNNIIESFHDLYLDPNTRELATRLIKHTFVSSGFFSGLNNYSSLIYPEILKDIGYNDFRKNLIKGLNEMKIVPETHISNMFIDLIIRNNPKGAAKGFTKVFDHSMFHQDFNDDFPENISTDETLIEMARRKDDMILSTELQPKYIRVYNPNAKGISKTAMYVNKFGFEYKRVTPLGRKGFFMEVSLNKRIEMSYLPTNNFKPIENDQSSKVENASADFNETAPTPTLEQGLLEPPTTESKPEDNNNTDENKTPPKQEDECD